MSFVITTGPPASPPIVRIVISCNFKAQSSVVSNVSVSSLPESNLLVHSILEWSHTGNNSPFQSMAILVRNGFASVSEGSD
jgi:hypothetical protein